MEDKYPEGHPDLYTYYIGQGGSRMGLQMKESQSFAQGKMNDGKWNDYGAEDSFDKSLATAEMFYANDAEKVKTSVGFLVQLYFIRYAVGDTSYGQKLKALTVKYPTYVKEALDNIQSQIAK